MDDLQYAQATYSTMMAPNYIFLTAQFETLLSTNHNPFIKPAALSEVDSALHDCTELSILLTPRSSVPLYPVSPLQLSQWKNLFH